MMARVEQTMGGFALRAGTWHLTGEFFGGDIWVRGAMPLPGIVISPEEATEIGLRFLALASASRGRQADVPAGAALVYARDAVAALEVTPATQRSLAVAIGAASQIINLGVRALGNLAERSG